MYGKYIFGENLIKHHIKIIYYTSGDIVSSALLFNLFISDYDQIYSFLKGWLFVQY